MKDKRLLVIPVVLVIALVTWLLLRARGDDASEITASGTIEATEADLGFQVGGRVAQVLVKEGDAVQRGDLLARLDQAELRARYQAADARLAQARAALAELERGARPQERGQARAEVEAARRRAEEARASLSRARKLYEGGAISKEDFDRAETAYTVARAQAQQAVEQQSLVNVGPRAERIAAQRAAVNEAQAVVEQGRAVLDNAAILAPFPGVITVRHREPGEAVTPGLPVLTLLNPADRWVRIYVREDQVGRVRIGQSAAILSDSNPNKAFRGRVSFKR